MVGFRRRLRRNPVVRARAEFECATGDRSGVENAGLHDHRLDPAEPAPVITMRQVGDRIDAFDGVPEVVSVPGRTAGANEVQAEYAALPTRVEHRLLRFANHRAESFLAAQVVYAVHEVLSSRAR